MSPVAYSGASSQWLKTQFSVIVTVVVLTAILPTIVAQRWFTPLKPAKHQPSRKEQVG